MSGEKIYLDINEVKKEFEAWRAAQTGRKALPAKLWATAVKLLDYYPAKLVCRELKLNPTRLQKHQELLKPSPSIAAGQKNKTSFLPLSPHLLAQSVAHNLASSMSAPAEPATCQLVVEKKDGPRLTLSLPLNWPYLEAFCTNLLKA